MASYPKGAPGRGWDPDSDREEGPYDVDLAEDQASDVTSTQGDADQTLPDLPRGVDRTPLLIQRQRMVVEARIQSRAGWIFLVALLFLVNVVFLSWTGEPLAIGSAVSDGIDAAVLWAHSLWEEPLIKMFGTFLQMLVLASLFLLGMAAFNKAWWGFAGAMVVMGLDGVAGLVAYLLSDFATLRWMGVLPSVVIIVTGLQGLTACRAWRALEVQYHARR